MRILHFSDFHLNDTNLKDWNNYVKLPLFDYLNKEHKVLPIDLIIISGDLLDKAGKDFDGVYKGLKIFEDEIVNQMHAFLKSDIPVIIIPGNHDIDRERIEPIYEKGLVEHFRTRDNVTSFIRQVIKENTFKGIERLEEYKKFEREFYNASNNFLCTNFGSAHRFEINEKKVGIAALNSCWRCTKDNDFNKIILGEEQLVSCTNFIKTCDIKIAVMHHPLDWLSNIEKGTIAKHINLDYNLLLIGHTHENSTNLSIGFQRNLFINIAPSGLNDIRTDSRSFANGFTLIDYEVSSGNVHCQYMKYNHNNKSFVINTDVENEGVFHATFPSKGKNSVEELINQMIINIKNEHVQEMDDHIVMHKLEKFQSLSLKEAFVFPPIILANMEDSVNNQVVSMVDITKLKTNMMFFGGQEAGKTVLLYRLIHEFIDQIDILNKVPVYIDYNLIGNKEIETVIKEYLRCNSQDVKKLLAENSIVLIVDNLNYKIGKEDLIKKLHNFYNNNRKTGLRIIATAENELSGVIPRDYIKSCTIDFSNYFINGLKSKEIKSLMRLWMPQEDDLHSDEKLEKMVANFCSYSLPSTAMSVSLYLWTMDNPDKIPINHAVLLEIYLELILQKLTKDNIYREKFDFTNKIQLISKIAESMLNSSDDNYSISYYSFIQEIENYLMEVGFDFIESSRLADYLIEQKIFIKITSNKIKFTYSCYFHFFLAKRMEYKPAFREYILDESRYHQYFREIDYYTALVRSDLKTLTIIYERFKEKYKELDPILSLINPDSYFTPIQRTDKYVSEVEKIEINKIVENRPSLELFEKYYDNRLESINDPSKIIKSEGEMSLELILLIMSNVFRNSEGIEDRNLKQQIYRDIIKNNIIFMILYKEWIIRYIKNYHRLPPSVPSEISMGFFLKNIPYLIQHSMTRHVGSPKLSAIILDKIKADLKKRSITGSEIELFLSIALYSDIQGLEFPKYLKIFIKKIEKNTTLDYMLYKIVEYFYRRTRTGSPNEKMYLDLLSDLKIKTYKLPKRMKLELSKAFLLDKRKFIEATNLNSNN